MRIRLAIGSIIAFLLLAGLGVNPEPIGSAEPRAEKKNTTDAYSREVRPLLAKYCLSCHGDNKPKGGLNLASLKEAESFKVWKHVWDRLKSRQMPPSDQPQPTPEERDRLTGWIEKTFAEHTLDGHPDPGPLHPRRLNVREQMNTFRDLAVAKDAGRPRRATYTAKPDGSVNLYNAIIPPAEHPCAFVPRFLPQDTNDGGFDTIGENLSIPPFLMEKYFRCSKVLLDDLFSAKGKDNAGRYQWTLREQVEKVQKGPHPKGMTQRQALTAFLKDFAGRAFRRPVTGDEVEKYAKLFDRAQEKGEDFENSIRLPLQAILVSPRFVVLWGDAAVAEPKKESAPVRPLDDYELATRLSYFLWSSLPDRELFLAAQQGRLRDPEVLEQQVRRMLRDQRVTDGFLEGFLCQWLQLDRLDRATPDAEKYAAYFQNNLAELMKQELLLFTDLILVEDRSILECIDTDWGFMCYPLAQHYGIENFPGKKPGNLTEPPWYRVKFADKRRGGMLTMGKVLTGTSQPLRTSPVHRGKWILETILGTPPPPPPPEVDNVLKEEKAEEGKKKLTVPQLMERHRNNAACNSCHRMIDPLGIAFETYDPVGKWRDKDQDQPIDARGALIDGKEFNGIVELKAILMARKDDFVRCFVEQMLAYALGRKLEFYDQATVKQIAQAVARDDYKLSRVVVEVAKSYPFRHRRTTELAE